MKQLWEDVSKSATELAALSPRHVIQMRACGRNALLYLSLPFNLFESRNHSPIFQHNFRLLKIIFPNRRQQFPPHSPVDNAEEQRRDADDGIQPVGEVRVSRSAGWVQERGDEKKYLPSHEEDGDGIPDLKGRGAWGCCHRRMKRPTTTNNANTPEG